MRYFLIMILFSIGAVADEFWTPYDVPSNRPFTSMAKAPDGTLYAAGAGVWSSPDGIEWHSKNKLSYMGAEYDLSTIGMIFRDIFVSSAGTLFLLPEDGIFLKSSDKGETWVPNTSMGDRIPAMAEAFGKLFIISGRKLWSSIDEGESWDLVYDYSSMEQGGAASRNIAVMGNELWFNDNGVIFTYDDDLNETKQLDMSQLASVLEVEKLRVRGFDSDGLGIVAVTDSFLVSYRLGDKWKYMKIDESMRGSVGEHNSVTMTSLDVFISSRDGVYHYDPFAMEITKAPYFPSDQTLEIFEVTEEGKYYACSFRGIFQYDVVTKESFKYSGRIGEGIYAAMVDKDPATRFLLAPNAVYRESGPAWTDLSDKLPPHEGSLLFANQHGGVLRTRNNQVYISNPSFEAWTPLYTGGETFIYAMGLTETGNAVVEIGPNVQIKNITNDMMAVVYEEMEAVMVDGNTVVLSDNADNGLLSLDGGGTWTEIPNIERYTTDYGYINSRTLKYRKGIFYCLTSSRAVLRSEDNMQTWDSLYTLPDAEGENDFSMYLVNDAFYITGDIGIYRSMDNCITWEDITFETDNMSGSFFMGKMSDGRMYVSVLKGVFSTANVPQSVEETPRPEIALYPQPADAVLNINFEDSDIREVSFYNLSGKKVKELNDVSGSRFRVGINELPKGLYLLKALTREGKNISASFVKK